MSRTTVNRRRAGIGALAATLTAIAGTTLGATPAQATDLPFTLLLPTNHNLDIYANGPHTSSSDGTVRNGVDLRMPENSDGSRPDLKVWAGAPGEVVYNDGCVIQVNHSSGYKIQYTHMDHTEVQVGQKIKTGTYLGYTGTPQETCGYGNGSHLHLSLWGPDGNPVSIDGTAIGDWTVHSGSGSGNYCGYWKNTKTGKTDVDNRKMQNCPTTGTLRT